MGTLVEQRKDARTNISWPVSMWLPDANKFFNGKSKNISKTGAFIRFPLTTPVKTGNLVELNFPRSTSLAEQKGRFARIKSGRVVRVERNNMLRDARIGVAVHFE